MLRPALLFTCVACLLSSAPPVRADDMDLALWRLRLDPQACGHPANSGIPCKDQELFERLASELAVAMAPPVVSAARTIGPRGFQFTLSSTITSIEGGQLYWRRGAAGPDTGSPADEEDIGGDEAAPSAMIWNHFQVRKGLPFGFELGLLLGQGLDTSMWSMGAALKWALFEGFRTGLGQLPDVSVQAAANRSLGSTQATVQVFAFDLALSKPFVIAQTWAVAPLLGLQLLAADVESDVIDLTPGGSPSADAYGACNPIPGHQATSTLACAEGGSDADFMSDVVFDPVSNRRLRMFLGGNVRYDLLTMSLSLLFDLTAPGLEADPEQPTVDSSQVAHQVAFSASVGVVL